MRERKDSDSPSGYDRDVHHSKSIPANVRAHAERLHDEAKILHLDPDRPHQDLALGAAGVAVIQKSRSLPAVVHAEDPWTGWARIRSIHLVQSASLPSYETAVAMAARWTVLAAAIDRAEAADPTTGGEAA